MSQLPNLYCQSLHNGFKKETSLQRRIHLQDVAIADHQVSKATATVQAPVLPWRQNATRFHSFQ
jgi:hypothetical protein